MKRTQRVEALKQVIAHTIKGERELAEALFKQVATSAAREILGEANYALDDDPEFDGRREMQRELEDDIESGQMEPGADELGGALDGEGCPECGAEPCECEPTAGGAEDTIDTIVSKLEAGDVDDEVLSMILDMINDETEGAPEGELGDELGDEAGLEPEGELGAEGEPTDSPVGDDGEIDLGALMKNESVAAGGDLLKKIKFALEYDYDQFMDAGGEQSQWPQVALGNPSPELEALLAQVPRNHKGAFNSMIDRIVHFQAGNSARLKDLI